MNCAYATVLLLCRVHCELPRRRSRRAVSETHYEEALDIRNPVSLCFVRQPVYVSRETSATRAIEIP